MESPENAGENSKEILKKKRDERKNSGLASFEDLYALSLNEIKLSDEISFKFHKKIILWILFFKNYSF